MLVEFVLRLKNQVDASEHSVRRRLIKRSIPNWKQQQEPMTDWWWHL